MTGTKESKLFSAAVILNQEPQSWPVPRWRLVSCRGQEPSRVARQALHQLTRPGWFGRRAPYGVFSASTTSPGKRCVFVAASSVPIGCALAEATRPPAHGIGWLSPPDLPLLREGHSPAVLELLKRAAAGAHPGGGVMRLSSLSIMPLPHRQGEMLLRASSGWSGRGIAWLHEGYLLALVWQN